MASILNGVKKMETSGVKITRRAWEGKTYLHMPEQGVIKRVRDNGKETAFRAGAEDLMANDYLVKKD